MLAGYKQLTFIEDEGNDYFEFPLIDFSNGDFEIVFDLQLTQQKSYNGLFSCVESPSLNTTTIDSTGKLYSRYNNSTVGPYTINTDRHTIRFSYVGTSYKVYVDEVQRLSATISNFTSAAKLRLLVGSNLSTSLLKAKIYKITATIANTDYEFVPCIREADDVSGLYDVEADEFYESKNGLLVPGLVVDPVTVNVTLTGYGSYVITGDQFIGEDITLTATPDAANVFAGWFNENNELVSIDSIYTFNATESVYSFTCKFVAQIYNTNVLEQYFDVYTSGDWTFSDSATLVQENIKMTFPRVLSAFNSGEGAVYKTQAIIDGMALEASDNTAFAGHIYNDTKLSVLSDQNDITNFFNNRPFVIPFYTANLYYIFKRKSDDWYFSVSVRSSDYSAGRLYNSDNVKMADIGACFQRGHTGSGGEWNTIGFVGYESDTFTENTGAVLINAYGLGINKDLTINSDNTGALIYNDTDNRIGITNWLFHAVYGPDNPGIVEPGSESGPGGGDGSFEFAFDFTPIEELPERISAVSSGFVALYQIPDSLTMQNISGYLWSSDFFDNIRKFIEKPEDSIISIHILPVELSASEVDFETMQAAGLKLFVPGHAGDSNYYIKADRVKNQYYIYDLGFIQCPEVWGSQLDYQPYTQAEIYLPYIGMQSIDIDEIAGKTLGLRYAIDLLNGDCMAFIAVDGNLKYQFSGNCLSNIPFSAQSKDYLTSAITLAAGLGAVATGGASAAAASAVLAGTANLIKKDISHGGGTTGTRGFLSLQKPVLYLHRPSQNLAGNYGNLKGYPSNITAKLGTLNGFTVVDSIHLEYVPATMEEKSEIETLLKQGVII